MPYENLSRERITQALRRLGELAREQKITLEISLYGGAVFTLVYGSRDSTKDVDAVVRQGEVAKNLALKVARELGLPEDWLNDDVKQFLAEKEAKRRLAEADFGEGLRISVPTAAYLLAMKLRACRPPLPGYAGDYGDIRFLVRKMGITSVEAAEAIHDKFFPHDALQDAAREVVSSAIEAQQP
jgi:predicted nucleotidyltransferase